MVIIPICRCGLIITADENELLCEATLDVDLTADHHIIGELPYYRNGRIYFTTGRSEGNAVIGLRNADSEVVWSWHIWSVEREITTSSGNGLVWMDRNLGAMNNDPGDNILNRGLIYQWGRKDPFPPTPISYEEAKKISFAMEQPQSYNKGKAKVSGTKPDTKEKDTATIRANSTYPSPIR